MAEISRVPASNPFIDVLTRVVQGKERVILYDQQGKAVAALVPIDEAEGAESEPATGVRRSRRARRAPLRIDDILAAARTLLMEKADPLPPWEAIKADPEWQQRWNDLLASVRSQIPPEVTSEEIESDIRAACDEVRQERLARRS
jgi:antitoxin (DNA-binding transcriptional repressor) of toxin-antitoxin stability system